STSGPYSTAASGVCLGDSPHPSTRLSRISAVNSVCHERTVTPLFVAGCVPGCPPTTASHPWSCHDPKTGRATSVSTDSGGPSSMRTGRPNPTSRSSSPPGRRPFSSLWAASTSGPAVIRPSPTSCAPPTVASSCRGRRVRSSPRRPRTGSSPPGSTRSSETQGSPAGRHGSGRDSRTVTARSRCAGGRPSTMAESAATEGSGRDEGRTGRPARLSRTSIVRTAIGLADRSGLEAVTMRAVAAELDGVAAALYRHVRGRDELIDLIRDEVLAERREVIETGEWRADLRDFVRGLLTIHEAHPWLATGGLPSRLGPRALATTETAMSLLSSHP